MKPKTLILAGCAAWALVLLTPRLISQDDPEVRARLAEREAQVRAQAGPEHWLLAKLAGEWTVETSFFQTGAPEPPVVLGEASGEVVAGERFVLLKLRIGSDPWLDERVTLFGFDRRVGQYTAVQVDSHGTQYVEATGSYDPGADRIVLDGSDTDPQLGTTARFQFVIQLEPEGFRHELRVVGPDGQSVALMESRFLRRE